MVSKSDLVFESSKEDIHIKKDIATQVGKALRPHAISGTGSSGLFITEIAPCYPEEIRGNFFGIHVCNLSYTLPLCELTPTIYLNKKIKEEL